MCSKSVSEMLIPGLSESTVLAMYATDPISTFFLYVRIVSGGLSSPTVSYGWAS